MSREVIKSIANEICEQVGRTIKGMDLVDDVDYVVQHAYHWARPWRVSVFSSRGNLLYGDHALSSASVLRNWQKNAVKFITDATRMEAKE